MIGTGFDAFFALCAGFPVDLYLKNGDVGKHPCPQSKGTDEGAKGPVNNKTHEKR